MKDSAEDSGNSPQKSNRIITLVALAIALVILAVIFVVALDNDNPKPWLDDHYTWVRGSDPDDERVVYRSDDSKRETFDAIDRGTNPDDRYLASNPDAAYLRYDADWIVTVRDSDDGSRIVLNEYDRAYHHHSGVLPMVWGDFHGRSGGGWFRGGGGGFGK